MADPDKLRLIIARLEAKLKPMHDEIDALRQRLEIAVLDKELAEEQVAVLQNELKQIKSQLQIAEQQLDVSQSSESIVEQLTARNMALSEQITKLSQQVADLEELRTLNDELEETWLVREQGFNGQINKLESQVIATTNKLKSAERQIADLQHAISLPKPEPPVTNEIDQELQVARLDLQHTKLDLRACRLDLQAAKSDIYATLASETNNKLFYKLKFLGCADPHIHTETQKLFDRYKYQDLTTEQAAKSAQELADVPWPNLESFWRPALAYLKDMGGQEVSEQPDLDSLLAALNDPTRPVKTLPVPVVAPEIVEPDETGLKIQLLEAKVAKARDLAAHVARLEEQIGHTSNETDRLKRIVEAQSSELTSKSSEIQALRDRPVSLDAATFNAKVGVLHSTIEFLMTKPRIEFAPLELKPKRLTNLAGHPAIRELTGLDFKVCEIQPSKWRPHGEKPGWVAAEQARALAKVHYLARAATFSPNQ